MTSLPELNNAYFGMRHGRSVPNEEGIIVADPRNGMQPKYGLVDLGIDQARETAQRSGLGGDTVIISSDLSRGRQTAEILADTIGASSLTLDTRLRERGFGELELQSADLYHEVWERDAKDATHTYLGVESLPRLAERQLKVVSELERKFARRTIVLVGHADPLNVLKAALWGHPLRLHRKNFSIGNAEMQALATPRKS